MTCLWRCIRNVAAIIGVILMYCAVSTSDYYVMELHTTEPKFVYITGIIGVILMVPAVIHLVRGYCK